MGLSLVRVVLIVGVIVGATGGCASGVCDSCPTATLTANGETELVVDVGTPIAYAWTSSHADAASSTVTIGDAPDACGNTNGPWVITSVEGSLEPEPILACQAGETYTMELEVVDSASAERETASLVLVVR